nr:MAG TPA: hypothetical protein [Caudoviricetes sp.]
MGLLNKDSKTDTSSQLCDMSEECSQYFDVGGKFKSDIQDDSLIFNTDGRFSNVFVNISSLNYFRDRFHFLSNLHINSSLNINIGHEIINARSHAPFHIYVGESVNISCGAGSSNQIVLDLSNISFECNEFTLPTMAFCPAELSVENITLRSRQVRVPIGDDINRARRLKGDIKAEEIIFRVDYVPAYLGDPTIIDNVSKISKPLSKLFKPLVEYTWDFSWKNYLSFRKINPIKLLGIEHYNASVYHFVTDYGTLTFTNKSKSNELRGTIRMADGWFAVINDIYNI